MRDKRLIHLALAAVAVFAVLTLCGHPLAGLLGGGALPIIGMAVPNEAQSEFVRTLAAWGVLDPMGGMLQRKPLAKTGNYTVLDPFTTTGGDASGQVFTNRGAGGAVTFTLPAVVPRLAGVFYDFFGVANQTFTVAGAAGTVVTFNNVAATSVACSTAGAKIGAHIRAICDGTSWIVNGDTVGGTYTVA